MTDSYLVCQTCGRYTHKDTGKPLDMAVVIPPSGRKDFIYCTECTGKADRDNWDTTTATR